MDNRAERPLPATIQRRTNFLLAQKKLLTKEKWKEIVGKITDFANGKFDPEKVFAYYPGWEKEDFENLLQKISNED